MEKRARIKCSQNGIATMRIGGASMSLIYITVCVGAGAMVCDDIGLGHIHPIKGLVILFALAWNVASIAYKIEKEIK